MAGRYHVKVDGQGFLLRPGSYRRSAAVAWPAGTPASTRASGWLCWGQSDWSGGDGHRSRDGATGEGGSEERRWASGYGVDVGEPGRVRLGPVLEATYGSNAEDGFAAMLALGGKLFAASSSSGKLYELDGSTWSLSGDAGKTSLRCLARHGSRIYVGSGSDGSVWSSEGGTWAEAFAAAGASSIGSMASYGVWSPTAKATVPRLFVGAEYPTGEAKLLCWDGSTLVEAQGCADSRVEAMTVYDGRLYVATSDSENGTQGRLLCYDGRGASGEWSEAASFSDNYVAGMAVFDNLLFCGSGLGGRLWAFDGARMAEAYSLSSHDLVYSHSLRGLSVCGGKLYVGYLHPTEGAALLCKLPWRGTGVGGQGTGAIDPRAGWFTPCTLGSSAVPRALGVYGGELYLACEEASAVAVYRRNGSAYRSSGLLETSSFDGRQPAVPKLPRSVTIGHEKLLAGQYLEVQFALEGTDTFQHVEEFDSLTGCDRAMTTADWRTSNSLVRLNGMPRQGFDGKTRGKVAVPHVARKLVTTSPLSPPATFSEEFGDAEYVGISGSGGSTAVFSNSAEGGRVHLLFELDLAGLNPAGLRPRAICYGKGDDSGSPALGVDLRAWNRATGGWDPVGTNSAAPEDGIAARTIEVTLSDFARYIGQSGKLYLSLSSSHAGSAANPAEVGVDLLELRALWEGTAEVVSEPLRLPVPGPISSATLTLLSATTPPSTWLELYMSADAGEHWEAVASGVEHAFANSGSDLRWKAVLRTATESSTPCIDRLKVDYLTGSWISLGRSDTEGATSAVLPFESGVTAKSVAFRIKLGSSDPSASPALSSFTFAYAVQPETRRRWEVELLCEGAAGSPLRLLDGSVETRTGRELSAKLWQAKARGTVTLEDLDGSACQVWFEELEEKLGDAAHERGVQTVAKCRFIEG